MSQLRLGYLYGTAAYICWGFFPLYFKVMRPAGPVEILAHRVLWSSVVLALLLVALRRLRAVAALLHRPRTLAGISTAATLIGVNWGVYIWGVNSGHVIETSLGYFINPLLTVALGMLFFGERLRRTQVVALVIGAAAVVELTVDYGRPPWIAVVLAVSFGCYSLVKKRLALPPADGLFVESSMLTVPALAYLFALSANGTATVANHGTGHALLLMSAGLVTAGPMLMFAAAANRIPLTSLGILQYLTPVLQLLCGLLVFHEPLPPARLLGFALVWLALVVFTWDVLRAAHRARSRTAMLATTSAVNRLAVGDEASPLRMAARLERDDSDGLVCEQDLAAQVQLEPGDLTGRQVRVR